MLLLNSLKAIKFTIMTVLGKSSSSINKPIIIGSPLVCKQVKYEEEKIEIQQEPWPTVKRTSGTSVGCILFCVLVVMFCGVMVGLMLHQQFVNQGTVHRYQGFCSIPISTNMGELDGSFRTLPLRWSDSQDIEVFTNLDQAGEDFVNALHEELDLGGSIEKITVIKNGNRVDFLHDFSDNSTGIVDDERCFVMALDHSLVLNPKMFMEALEQGDEFDVTRVRTDVKASIPAMPKGTNAASELAAKCVGKPTYHLYSDGTVGIRKRSVDDPKHDYMQFSGKHVLEIKIENLAEVLEYENRTKA